MSHLGIPLHIVEPTLSGEAGHCMSLVQALSEAAHQSGCHEIMVWGGHSAGQSVWPGPAHLRPHFHRRWRRFQALALYRQLLRQPGRILISTANSTDLISLDWAARSSRVGQIPAGKVSLFVHWLNIKPGKAKLFKGIARRQPHIQILAPTARVVEFFKACGFTAQQVPYPLDTSGHTPGHTLPTSSFRHLLVPGAARMDKGFGHVVDLVEAMAQRGLDCPITIQTSMEHGHHKDQALADALSRLRSSRYPHLRLNEDTMDRAAYRAQFQGAVVIQPYRAEDFLDRVSGVTLDALHAGAPVVVTEGTWMARLVHRFKAGVTTADLSPAGLMSAIETILADHAAYADRARAAAIQVQADHSAKGLMDAVLANA